MTKKAKITLWDEIMRAKYKTPGPSEYDSTKKYKIKGTYNDKSGKGAYVKEIEYRALITPCLY